MADRLKPGPASPEVLRQKLKEEMARTSKERAAERAAETPAAKPRKKRAPLDRGQQLRRGPDGKTVMDAVDEAVRGAKGANPDY